MNEMHGNDEARTQQPRMWLNNNIGYSIFNPVPGLLSRWTFATMGFAHGYSR